MKKYSVTIDVSKINKGKIIENTFKAKDGKDVSQLNYKMDVIIQDADKHKVVKASDTYIMKKIGFVCEQQTKEERASKAESVFIGDVLEFDFKNDGTTETDSVDDDLKNIPF